jgi:putative transposase
MDGGTWYHPQARATLALKHRLHSTFEKSIVERSIEYVKKDRTESFDDYYPCIKKECNLLHVYQWMMILFMFMMYNAVKSHLKFSIINELIRGGNP